MKEREKKQTEECKFNTMYIDPLDVYQSFVTTRFFSSK